MPEPVVGTTGSDGVCVVRHLQQFQNPDRDLDVLPRFGVRGVGLRSADVEFDATAPPLELELRLPTCSICALEVRDSRGDRSLLSDTLCLVGQEKGDSIDEFMSERGSVDLGLVPCDLDVAVKLNPEDESALLRSPGPREPGQRFVLSVQLEDLAEFGRLVIGRAILADQTPAAGLVITTHQVDTRVQANGRFALLLRESSLLNQRELRIVEHHHGVDRRGGTCRIPRPLKNEPLDLGTVILRDARVLIRGRIRVEFGPLVEPVLQVPHGQEAVVRPDGGFEVRGLQSEARIGFLHASARGCGIQELSDVPIEGKDLDIVLSRVGSVRAVITVDPDIAELYEQMRIDLIDDAGTRRAANVYGEDTEWDCTWDMLPLGRYRLEVRPFTAGRSILDLPPIDVVAEDGTTGASLTLDLRRRLKRMRLSLRDAEGQELDADFWIEVTSTAKLFRDRRGKWHDSMWIDGDGCILLAADNWVAIRVGNGTLSGSYTGPCTDTTLRLWSGSTVRITGLPVAPKNARWQLHFEAESGDGAILHRWSNENEIWSDSVTANIDEEGRCGLALIPNTRYSFRLALFFHDGDRPESHRDPRIEPSSLRVDASPPREIRFRVVGR